MCGCHITETEVSVRDILKPEHDWKRTQHGEPWQDDSLPSSNQFPWKFQESSSKVIQPAVRGPLFNRTATRAEDTTPLATLASQHLRTDRGCAPEQKTGKSTLFAKDFPMRAWSIYLLLSVLGLGCNRTETNQPQPTENQLSQTGDELKQHLETQPARVSKVSHVLTADTEYYTTGPQQGRPADGKFLAGTKVSIVEDAGSYLLVQPASGLAAYIIADVVEPLTLQGTR
jgi:hypothetical protein